MKTTRSRLFYIVFGFTLGHLLIGATPVAAQGDCRLVFDATSKVFSTPAHIYVTTNIGGKPQIMEEIYAAGAIYMNIDGKWSPGTMSIQEMKQLVQKNIQTNKTTCRYLKDEPVNGEMAACTACTKKRPGVRPILKSGFPRRRDCRCARRKTWATRITSPRATNTATSSRRCEVSGRLEMMQSATRRCVVREMRGSTIRARVWFDLSRLPSDASDLAVFACSE
jgi:hypothetical protein